MAPLESAQWSGIDRAQLPQSVVFGPILSSYNWEGAVPVDTGN